MDERDTDPTPTPEEHAPTGGEALDDVHESELSDAPDLAGAEALDDDDDS